MAAVKKISPTKSLAAAGRGKRIKTEDPGTAPRKQGKTKTGHRIGHTAGLSEGHNDLPNTSANNTLYLFPVDPYHIFSYWEINSAELDKIRTRLLGKYKHLTPTLRFFYGGGTESNSQKVENFFDLTIDLHAGKQYIELWKSGRACFADLGFKNEHGRFFPICRSNTIETPHDMSDAAGLQCYASSPAHSDLSYMNDRSFLPGISSMPAES
jgi:hypothetical protein